MYPDIIRFLSDITFIISVSVNIRAFFIILVWLDEFNQIKFIKNSETWPGIEPRGFT